MTEASLKTVIELFFTVFPVPLFFQALQALAAVGTLALRAIGIDFPVVAF